MILLHMLLKEICHDFLHDGLHPIQVLKQIRGWVDELPASVVEVRQAIHQVIGGDGGVLVLRGNQYERELPPALFNRGLLDFLLEVENQVPLGICYIGIPKRDVLSPPRHIVFKIGRRFVHLVKDALYALNSQWFVG